MAVAPATVVAVAPATVVAVAPATVVAVAPGTVVAVAPGTVVVVTPATVVVGASAEGDPSLDASHPVNDPPHDVLAEENSSASNSFMSANTSAGG